MVVALGVDVHKKSHTVVAADAAGRQLAQLRVQASQEGDQQALRWARTEFPGEELVWGVEDCRSYSMRLERDLLAAGQQVRRAPAKLMAQCRASARTVGKSDPIDALAVARAVLREPALPTARLEETARELRLLVDHREHLVQQRTRWINRLRVHLQELDPQREPRTLTSRTAQRRLAEWLTGQPGLAAELAGDALAQVSVDTVAILELEKRIARLVAGHPLQQIVGCAALTAAKIIGETGGIDRFGSEACYARHTGVAPIPVWSGNTAGRVRLSRSGNRQLNAALHRIALTQRRCTDSEGHAYYQRRRAAGLDRPSAMRCLKRQLNKTVYRILLAASNDPSQACFPDQPTRRRAGAVKMQPPTEERS